MRQIWIAFVLLALSLISTAPARAQNKIEVVASFTILADLVRNVAGDRAQITTLIGPGGDAHVYTPSPADAKRIAAARLVIVNGLGFEGWLPRLVKSSGSKATVIEASRGIKPLEAADADHDHKDHNHGKAHTHDAPFDPHAWQSVANVKVYVGNIRDALAAADPDGAALYAANAADYLGKLDALDGEIRAAIAKIPAQRRKVISTHDAFSYFADAYGIAFIAPQGVSTDAEASARAVARIIKQIKAEAIPAVFIETITDPRLMRRIAAETGAKIGGALYSDSLTDENGEAPTYIAMVRHNIKALTSALGN